jgi:mannose-6-phosphate isomerase-like protein (cupin superfamily)
MRSKILAVLAMLLVTPVSAPAQNTAPTAKGTPYPGFSCATLLHKRSLTGAAGVTVRVVKQTYAQSGAAGIHHHQVGEIVYLLSGSGTNTMKGTTTPLSADSAIYIPPGTDHYISPAGSGSVTVLAVQFTGTSTPSWQPKSYHGPNVCND